jgi:hypothetical protein
MWIAPLHMPAKKQNPRNAIMAAICEGESQGRGPRLTGNMSETHVIIGDDEPPKMLIVNVDNDETETRAVRPSETVMFTVSNGSSTSAFSVASPSSLESEEMIALLMITDTSSQPSH